MAWIRPNPKLVPYVKRKRVSLPYDSAIRLSEMTGKEVKPSDIDQIFDVDEYFPNVFTAQEQIDDLLASQSFYLSGSKVFVGMISLCGGGHYFPAFRVLQKLVDEGYDVLLLDVFMIERPRLARLNSILWNFIARHFQFSWKLVRAIVSTELGSDFVFQQMESLYTPNIQKLIHSLGVYGVFSTHSYSNVILPLIAKDVERVVLIVPDVSATGFVMNPLREFSGIEYVVNDNKTINEALDMYEYLSDVPNDRWHITHNTPCFMDIPNQENKQYDNVLFASVGSCCGIGKGNQLFPTFTKYWQGTLILDCGSNQQWKKEAIQLKEAYPRKDIIVTGCIQNELYEDLFRYSEATFGKAGGSFGSESALKTGVTGLGFGVGSQENDNMLHWKSCMPNPVVSVCMNQLDVIRFCLNRPKTVSIRQNTKATNIVYDLLTK